MQKMCNGEHTASFGFNNIWHVVAHSVQAHQMYVLLEATTSWALMRLSACFADDHRHRRIAEVLQTYIDAMGDYKADMSKLDDQTVGKLAHSCMPPPCSK